MSLLYLSSWRLFESRYSICLFGSKGKTRLGFLGLPLISAEILPSPTSNAFGKGCEFYWGFHGEDRDAYCRQNPTFRHLLILFCRVLLSCQLSYRCWSFSSFLHPEQNKCPTTLFLKISSWVVVVMNDRTMVLVTHPAPQIQCLAPRGPQPVSDE